MSNYKGILPKGFLIDEKYSILLFIKQGSNAETYRVKGKDGKLYFLKLFNYSKLSRTAFDSENNLLEIEFLKNVQHENIVSYKDSGELIFESKKFGYLILNFIAGETLAERILQLGGKPLLSPEDWFKASACGYAVPSDEFVKAILTQNIEGEQCAILTYNKLLEFIGQGDPITAHEIGEIMEDEVEHEQDLQNLLEDLETFIK